MNRKDALDIVQFIAERVSNPASINKILRATPDGDAFIGHEPRGLDGAAAAAILHSTTGDNDRNLEIVHELLVYATADVELDDWSMFSGWTGIGMACKHIARGTGRYRALSSTIRAALSSRILNEFRNGIPVPQSSHQFELVQGYAGAYLLLDPVENPEARDCILRFYEWLFAAPDHSRWNLVNRFDRLRPHAHNVLGLSHGIAGVLAALCAHGRSERELRLMTTIADILLSAATNSADLGPQWGYALGELPLHRRVAWCHFSLGIAVSLWNAGKILRRSDLANAAVESTRGMSHVPVENWGMVDHGFCHGTAGSALLFQYLGNETGDIGLKNLATDLTSMLISGFDESKIVGYVAIYGRQRFDDHGLLMGAAGIALALLTLTDKSD